MFGSKSTVSHRIICCSEKEGLFYISGTNHELEYMQIINYDTMILRKQENSGKQENLNFAIHIIIR